MTDKEKNVLIRAPRQIIYNISVIKTGLKGGCLKRRHICSEHRKSFITHSELLALPTILVIKIDYPFLLVS